MQEFNLLMLHGNGGGEIRFQKAVRLIAQNHPHIQVLIPKLDGFDGRPIDRNLRPFDKYWDLFLSNLGEGMKNKASEPWIFYGHGIGGSLLLELATRDFTFPNGQKIHPRQVILHSCIGASLQKRWFPTLMKPPLMRALIKFLVTRKALRPRWTKKLFLHPEKIDQDTIRRFFEGYVHCQAFAVFFDIITPTWYQSLFPRLSSSEFTFLWGDKERVVASRYLELWKRDFPQSHFNLIKNWDHFPMLEDPEEFVEVLVKLIQIIEEEESQGHD